MGIGFCSSLPALAGNLSKPLPQKVLESIDGVQIVVTEFPGNPRPDLVYFLPHQDERIAREAAYQLLPETGGKIVEIRQPGVITQKSGPCRNLLLNGTWLDPNQMFTSEGIVYSINKILTRHPESPRPPDLFQFVGVARTVSALALNALGIGGTNTVLVGTQITPLKVIALHNNTPGSFNIRSYAPGGSYGEDAGEPPFSTPTMDPDDFVLVTRREDFEKLRALGVNTVFENIQRDNGGLSLVAHQQGLQYFNVEVQHRYNRPDTCTNAPKSYSGHLEQQKALVRLILNQVAVNESTLPVAVPPTEGPAPSAIPPGANVSPPVMPEQQPLIAKPAPESKNPEPTQAGSVPINPTPESPSPGTTNTAMPTPATDLAKPAVPVSGKSYRPPQTPTDPTP
jgi:hypothetical protein